MSQLKIKEVAASFSMSEGNIRRILKESWKEGQIVTGSINVEGLREYLKAKFGEDATNAKLGFPIDELDITIGERSQSQSSLNVEELEKGKPYVLKNYHFETNATYIGETKIDKLTLWIFQTDKGYKAYSEENINNNHFWIYNA